jgi:hypothetical protein
MNQMVQYLWHIPHIFLTKFMVNVFLKTPNCRINQYRGSMKSAESDAYNPIRRTRKESWIKIRDSL